MRAFTDETIFTRVLENILQIDYNGLQYSLKMLFEVVDQ